MPMPDRMKIGLLLAPALLVIGLLFFGGLGLGVRQSLDVTLGTGLARPNVDNYQAILTTPEVYRSLGLTLYFTVTSTVLASAFAVATAMLLRRQFRGRAIATFLVQLNLTIPHVVAAIGMLYLFSQSGSFARLAHAIGLIDRPANFPALVFDPYAIGIIISYVWKEVPFITMVILATLQTLADDHEPVAATLGATRWQAFRYVIFPQILPGLTAASAIVFAFIFGAYEIPALLGASHPQALAVMAYRKFTDADIATRSDAIALALLIAVASAIMIAVYARAVRGKWRGRS